ncbi:hypothetical protein [Caballeronia ptereochthonis]|uniref:Transcriptional regulator n=1 Tax=Caballeronia ptereochthonis TaxID=1777144 RepID=A0A158BFQ5_9BURK|nr:hypothetical protein [Caballeronia ptereochthonis]SAK68889.1 transcriptional regulator [Caballeronia ptereochthonis]
MQLQRPTHHYRGYAVHPSAHRLPDGSFSSDLLLERAQPDSTTVQYRFYSLDYFVSEHEAVQHSSRWARDWVETRG